MSAGINVIPASSGGTRAFIPALSGGTRAFIPTT
jgi:hypothetical protein